MVTLVTYFAFHCLVLAAACSMIRRKGRSPAWVLLIFFFPPAIYALGAAEAKGRGYRGERNAAEAFGLLVPPASLLMAIFLHFDRAHHARSIVDEFPDCRSARAARDVKRVWDGSVTAQNMDVTLVGVRNATVVPSLPGQQACEADFVFSNETVAHYDFSYDIERGAIFVHMHLLERGRQYL